MSADFNDSNLGETFAKFDNSFDYISLNTKTLGAQQTILNEALFGKDVTQT